MPIGGIVRRFTPLILIALCVLVWFGPYLPGYEALEQQLGSTWILRFALGLVCVFVLIQILEQRRLELLFKQVIDQFRNFHQRQSEGGGAEADVEQREQAVRILISALASPDAAVAANARDHLQRLTGADLGAEPGAWEEWAAAEFGKK